MTENEKLFVKECNFPKIRKLWKPRAGDIIYDRHYGKFGIIYDVEINIKIIYVSWLGGDDLSDFTPDENTIWLPSLSQIIEMISKKRFYCSLFCDINNEDSCCVIQNEKNNTAESFKEEGFFGATPEISAIKALKEVLKGER